MTDTAATTATAPAAAPAAPPATEGAVVVVRDLVKKYGEFTAVANVAFDIRAGEVYGLLGPNGAGKTTCFKLFTAAVPRTGGTIGIFGLDPEADSVALKSRLGVVNQEDTLDADLNVINNLRIYGQFFGLRGPAFMQRAEALLAFMDLAEKRKAKISALSGGMKRRLMIARALLNSPRLLMLDEPTTGLDPQVRHAIWKALRQLKQQGLTILLTTHYMEEAAQLADRVGIMHKGKLIAEGTPKALIRDNLPAYVLEFGAVGQPDWRDKMAADAHVEEHGDRVYAFANDEPLLRSLLAKCDLHNATIRPTSLEDVFLKLTGHHLEEG